MTVVLLVLALLIGSIVVGIAYGWLIWVILHHLTGCNCGRRWFP